jgi:hypothetical protein
MSLGKSHEERDWNQSGNDVNIGQNQMMIIKSKKSKRNTEAKTNKRKQKRKQHKNEQKETKQKQNKKKQ